ncbi:TrkH family potassium uptake protein [Pelagovum pacificum]|uniref:Potassium transporter KtrB n=1 Tax=Pelagovum pacificum TaxID=2588711 RepID=A0A5C5GFA5_9RHOB|nr:potassium transporter TrkG [Pelagovum pacificum]QQA44124.1 potassium transporter KtrB [Pelagovum pacificum]TNY32747.1 potassium transporter KtrB [Pelagovum pacificum]
MTHPDTGDAPLLQDEPAVTASRLARIGGRPATALLAGYSIYILLGTLVLLLPLSRVLPVSPLDALFIATSAVSTTGLVTVDPGTTFSLFGEIAILLMIQVGGLGYMTIGSVALLTFQERLSAPREALTRTAFDLPGEIKLGAFLRAVVLFTLTIEALGAAALYLMFKGAGVADPGWSALFHAVSAFCTAGFSLFPDSLERFSGHPGVLLVVSALSLFGAMGFLIVVDVWRALHKRRARLGFTTRIIVRVTAALIAIATLLLFVADPAIAALPFGERMLAAFFQSMTAATTVGFNSVPIGGLSAAMLMALVILMVIGASPAGTGGGIKTTAFATLVALVRATLRGKRGAALWGHRLPDEKVRIAAATLAYYCTVMCVALLLLLMTESGAAFEAVLFETVSAMGTVGLSAGLTGDLTPWGKLILIVLMTAGRLGILTFGIAITRFRPEHLWVAERAEHLSPR